jgi:hypothetical protein
MLIIKLILTFIVGYFIAGIVHELGHVIVGLIQGFRFYMLVVGPIGIVKDLNGKVRIYFEKRVSFWGGVGGTVPQKEESQVLDKFSKILLGGPIFSIIFGAILLPLGVLWENIYLVMLGAMPIGMGIVSLIPMRAGAFYSDGGRWFRIRNEKTRAIEAALLNITMSLVVNDDSHKNISVNDIDTVINSSDAGTRYMGHYFACMRYKDRGEKENYEKAKILLDEASKTVSKQIRSLYKL